MNIISKIEINYFRSIYTINLSNVSDLNVFVGGNDAGKSNILRALNLFFNKKTDLNTDFNFNDITKYRVDEARDAKGRLTLWMKITFLNVEKWKSLPASFTIKKSWDRNGDETISYPNHIDKRNLSRFLNKINFHYVPAIRSRDTFSYYLGMIHDCLLKDTKAGLSEASQNLTETINNAVVEMSNNIEKQLGFESKIEVPQNFKDLFEALDFSTKFGEYDIPLQKRGDGIQARHIPHILDFIAKQDYQHHIWAYEEPENSLEMFNAFKLAQQFQTKFCKENQIFITTHSPAFYDLSADNVSKWLISSEQYKDTIHKTSTAATLSNNDDKPDSRLGIAEFIKTRAREVFEEKELLEKNVTLLQKEVSTFTQPVIVTEGKHDVTIFTTAWRKLYPNIEIPYALTSCNNGESDTEEQAGVTQLKSFLENILNSEQQVKIGIFDNDSAGLNAFNQLKKYKNIAHNIKCHENGNGYAILLPKPDNSNNEYWNTQDVCIEFLFKKEVLTQSYVKEVCYGVNGKAVQESQLNIIKDKLNDSDTLNLGYNFDYKIKPNRKAHFANTRILDFDQNYFENFRILFETINESCTAQ